MKRKKLLEILHAATNSQSTSFAALDNTNMWFGTQDFANIQRLSEDVAKRFCKGLFRAQEMKEELVKLCKESETFLKHTFPDHLQAESSSNTMDITSFFSSPSFSSCGSNSVKHILSNIS